MPDPGRRFTARRNDAPPGGDVNPEHCPELTQEVKRADIPVLDQQVAAEALQENIPVLEETFTMFEKTIPVLRRGGCSRWPDRGCCRQSGITWESRTRPGMTI